MCSNRLKLNADKTQFIWLGAPRQLQQVSSVQLIVDGVPASLAGTVRASPLTLSCRSSSTSTALCVAASINCDSSDQFDDPFQTTLCAPWYMRSSQVALTTVNAVLYGVSAKVVRRLQAVLHAAGRLITGVRRNQHITATLRDTLH